MLLQKCETATTGVSCQVQNCFSPGGHFGGYSRCGGEINISRNAALHKLCGRGPQCDRQGKSFTKPCNLTVAVVCLTSDLYSLSHVERLEISKKAVLPPETPPKFLHLTGSRGISDFNSFPSDFANFVKSILNVAPKT